MEATNTRSDIQTISRPVGEEVVQSFRGEDELDPTRAFVASAVKYYDERWRWMDWSGQIARWNWAAALGGPIWFAYRRLKIVAACYLIWLAAAGFLFGLGASFLPLLGIQMLIMAAAGYYATFLYGRRFRREMRRAFHHGEDEAERARILRDHGGSSYRAAAVAIIALPLLGFATQYVAEEVDAIIMEAVSAKSARYR